MIPGKGSNPPPMPPRPGNDPTCAPLPPPMPPPAAPILEDETHEKLCGVRIGDETGEKDDEWLDGKADEAAAPREDDPPFVGIG